MTYAQQQNTTAPATKCNDLERKNNAWYTFHQIMKHGNLGCHGCGKYHAALKEGDNLELALKKFTPLPKKSDESDVSKSNAKKSDESDVSKSNGSVALV